MVESLFVIEKDIEININHFRCGVKDIVQCDF
jgi:hypothetical protein